MKLIVALLLLALTWHANATLCLNGGTPVTTLVTRTVDQPSTETMARVDPITFGAYHWFVIAGGRALVDQRDPGVPYYTTVTLFDIETGNATNIGSMSTARSHYYDDTIPGVVNEATGTMIIAGGTGSNDAFLKSVEIYNFFTHKWSTSSLSVLPVFGVQCFVVRGQFYVLSRGAKTIDRFDGVTGKWRASANIGYPPAAGLETLQSGAVVGDSMYFTTGVDGQLGIQALVKFNTTNNLTSVIYVPLPGWCCQGGFINPGAYGSDLLFINPDGLAFVWNAVTNTSNNSISIPQFTTGYSSYITRSIVGTTKGMYYIESHPSLRPMTQYIAASTSFAAMGTPFLPNRLNVGLAYNARLGVFAIIDGATSTTPSQPGINAINMYQESDMQLMSSFSFNQTTCQCPAGFIGFLCSQTSGAPATGPHFWYLVPAMLAAAWEMLS